MHYVVETPTQSPRLATSRLTPSSEPIRRGPAGVVDSASYQAMLADLGLEPNARLCVPAVHSCG